MRLSYYGGGHYDSIVNPWHAEQILRRKPGELEDYTIARSKERTRANAVARGRIGISSIAEVQRISDQLATEQAAVDAALQESRRLYLNRDYDDLETSLNLSMRTASSSARERERESKGEDISPIGRQPAAASSSSSSSSSSSLPLPFKDGEDVAEALDTDVVAVQGELLRSVTEQSEREYLEKAILSSLATETILSEDDMLQQVQLASAKDFEMDQEKHFLELAAANSHEGASLPSSHRARCANYSSIQERIMMRR
jgi:hypothetical protein